MNTWTRQNNYPIVRCELTGPGRIKLSQMPYPRKEGNASALWWIPIAMTDSNRADFGPSGTLPRLWLSPDRPTIEVSIRAAQKGGWYILNSEMAGYFRVQYDPATYERISEQLRQKHTVFPDYTRSQLINDAFTLAEADLIDYEIPLQLINYLKVVKDDTVDSIVSGHLTRMKELCTDLTQKKVYEVIDSNTFFIFPICFY